MFYLDLFNFFETKMSEFIVNFSTIFLYFVLMILSIKKGFNSVSNRTFFIFVSGIFFWTLTLYIYLFINTGDWLLFWGRINYASAYPMCFGLVSFFYFFPRKSVIFSKKIELSVLFVTIILTLLTLFTSLIDKSETIVIEDPQVELGLLYPIYLFYLVIHLFFAFFLGYKKMIKSRGVEKTKVKYIFLGFIPVSAFLLFTNVLLPIFGIYFF